MTMNEAIQYAVDLGGAYIMRLGRSWKVIGRSPKGTCRGLIWVAFDGTTFRV